MKENKVLYPNASVIIGGGICVLLMANSIFGKMSNGDEPSLIPGLSTMVGLCFLILCFWAGMLLRTIILNPKLWQKILLAGIALLCLYGYRHASEDWGYADALYASMAMIGFLIPPQTLLSASRNKGWISLILLAVSAFCYTALVTVEDRLLWKAVIPEHPDMELMLEKILINAEPFMVIVVTYFAVQFAFSEIAQKLGAQIWFKGVAIVSCIYTFCVYFIRLFSTHLPLTAIDSVYYCPLTWFIVQPITIYLIVICVRLIRESGKSKEERSTWKELIKL